MKVKAITWSLIAIAAQLTQLVEGSGKLEIQFVEFAITKYIKCDCAIFVCEKEGGCDPYFTVCAKPIYHASSSRESCLGGDVIVTSTLHNTNKKIFTNAIGSTPNPLLIPFQTWPISGIKVNFDIKDDDGDNQSYQLEKLSTQLIVLDSNNGSKFTKLSLSGGKTRLSVNIKYYCDEGWYGDNCSMTAPPPAPAQNINKCSSHPCIYGNCSHEADSYLCSCESGYTGLKCDTQINECASDPCGPNAECKDILNGYTCLCKEGYTGDTCEVNIDDCVSASCVHGTCVDGIASFQCQCLAGFTGKLCEHNVDDCSLNPCENNGSCVDGINMYTCQCEPGFTGQNCQTKMDFCKSQPCGRNGRCTSKQSGYSCQCDKGFSGVNCETNIDECLTNTCGEHGRCVDGIASYSCDCELGYTGKLCDVKIDYCVQNQCRNGSTCISLIPGYKCICLPDKVGVHCEVEDPCLNQPCLNEGLCKSDNNGTYTCKCKRGYQGMICQHKMIFPSVSQKGSNTFVLKEKLTAFQTKSLLDVVQEATALKLNVPKQLITVKSDKQPEICNSTSSEGSFYRVDFTVWLETNQLPADLVQESLQNPEAQRRLPKLTFIDAPCTPSSAQVSHQQRKDDSSMMYVYIASSVAVGCLVLGSFIIFLARSCSKRRQKDIEQYQSNSYPESIPEKYTTSRH